MKIIVMCLLSMFISSCAYTGATTAVGKDTTAIGGKCTVTLNGKVIANCEKPKRGVKYE